MCSAFGPLEEQRDLEQIPKFTFPLLGLMINCASSDSLQFSESFSPRVMATLSLTRMYMRLDGPTGFLFLILSLFILVSGTNGARAPPPWIPLLIYILMVARIFVVLIGTCIGDASSELGGYRCSSTRWAQLVGTPSKFVSALRACDTGAVILLLGVVSFAIFLPLAVGWQSDPPSFDWMRLALGLGYSPLNVANLPAVGYVLGGLFLLAPLLLCTCFCCQGFGRSTRASRLGQLYGRGREPFIDLVENRVTLRFLAPALFVYGFALPSSFILAGSALLGPHDVLPLKMRAPVSLSPLCRSAVSALLQDEAAMIADDAGLAWVLVDAQWRSRFAAQPRYCGSDPSPILQSAAAQADGSAKALISFAVRDEALMGVGGVALNGTIVDFEPWDPTGSPAGSPRLSGSALSVSNVSSTVGVAMLSLSLEGCSSGVLTLNVSTYGCGDCEECDPQVTCRSPPTPYHVPSSPIRMPLVSHQPATWQARFNLLATCSCSGLHPPSPPARLHLPPAFTSHPPPPPARLHLPPACRIGSNKSRAPRVTCSLETLVSTCSLPSCPRVHLARCPHATWSLPPQVTCPSLSRRVRLVLFSPSTEQVWVWCMSGHGKYKQVLFSPSTEQVWV